jgi:hypothetical protein
MGLAAREPGLLLDRRMVVYREEHPERDFLSLSLRGVEKPQLFLQKRTVILRERTPERS